MIITPKKSSVSRDFLLLFFVLIFIVSIVAVWVAYRTFDNYVDEIISDIKSETLRIDRSMIVEIKDASYLMESLSRQIVQLKNNDEISRLLGSFNDSNDGRNNEINWLNANQNVIISSISGFVNQKINFSDLDYIKKSLAAPWQVHIGRPNNSKITNKWILPLSIGVTNYKGDFIGILMIGIDIASITKELKKVMQIPEMDFNIFTTTMNSIADSRKLEKKYNILDSNQITLLSQQVEKKKKGIISEPYLFNQSIPFAYFAKSSQYPYIIYINHNHITHQDEIFKLLRARMIQILLIFCFLLTLLWLVKTRIIKPVEKLCEITANINAGGRYQPISRGGPLEIEQLANQIRKLSDYLIEQNRTNNELKVKNQYLNKIKEGTEVLDNARINFLMQTAHEMEQPLQQLNHSIGEIIANNPNNHASSLEAMHHIEMIKLIIGDINYTANAQYAKLRVRENSINLNFIMHRAIRKFHEFQRFTHIEVRLKIDDNLPILLGDEDIFTDIIIYILCGASANISQGSAIELNAQMEYNEHNHKELNIHVKYSSPIHNYKDKLVALENVKNHDKYVNEPAIKSSIMNFLMARMLVTVLGGNLSINVRKGETNRIFLRFPQNIIIN